jgi:restriction system protein
MKRFLRYLLYREIYRTLRKAAQSSESEEDSQPIEPDKAIEERGGQAQAADLDTSRLPGHGDTLENEAQLKAALQQMDPYEFEHFVADLWERMGWQTDVSTESADEGVDVIARKDVPYEQVTLIQAKRYGPNTTVGSPDIQQYASLKKQYDGVDKVAIVTTNEFTQQAQDLADRLNVKLINGDDLVELIVSNEAAELVVEYLDFLEFAEEPAESEQKPAAQHPDTTRQQRHAEQSHHPEPTQPAPGEIPTTPWQGVVAVATLGWVGLLFTVNFLPEVAGGLLILAVWFGLPLGLYLDSRTVQEHVDWPEYRWLYLVCSVIWIVAIIPGAVYLWKRHQLAQQNEPTATAQA